MGTDSAVPDVMNDVEITRPNAIVKRFRGDDLIHHLKLRIQFVFEYFLKTVELRFDEQKTTFGTIARAGSSPFSAQAVLVNTTSLNAQNEVNIRTDLTGQVKVKFRSETFPLERFADSGAIQLINTHARVPGGGGNGNAEAEANAGSADDPWAPR